MKLLPLIFATFLSLLSRPTQALSLTPVEYTECSSMMMDTCVEIGMSIKSGNKGDTVCIQVSLSNFKDMLTAQFSINWDPSVIQFLSFNNDFALDKDNLLIGTGSTKNGVLRVLWTDPTANGTTIPDSSIILELCFKLIGAPGSSSPVVISNFPVNIEFTNFSNPLPLCVVDKNKNDKVVVGLPTDLCITTTTCGTLGNNGTFTLTPFGGTAPYMVTINALSIMDVINNRGESKVYNNLSPGTFVVVVKDATGKDSTFNITIHPVPGINILIDTIRTKAPSCPNSADGRITVTATGGTGTLFYHWLPINAFGVRTLTDLPAGIYTLIVKDSLGCEAQITVDFTSSVLNATAAIVSGSNCVSSDGIAIVCGSGGKPFAGKRYDFNWLQNPSSNRRDSCITATTLSGNQSVIITDSIGCMDTVDFIIPVKGGFNIATRTDSVRCFGETNGAVNIVAKALTTHSLPYAFTLTFASSGSNIPGGITRDSVFDHSGLVAGKYYIDITDNSGCSRRDSFFIFQPQVIDVILIDMDSLASCNPGNDAFIEVRGAGGNGGYKFNWAPGNQTTSRINNVGAGTYTVTLTDAKGCVDIDIYRINQASGGPIIDTLLLIDSATCQTSNDGHAEVLTTPSTGVRFSWSCTNETTSEVFNLAAGVCTLTVTDQNNCSTTKVFNVPVKSGGMQVIPTVNDARCNGSSDGLIILETRGGRPPYVYKWDNGGSSNINANLKAGKYIVTVTDGSNCPPFIDTFMVNEPPKIRITVLSVTGPSCEGNTNCDGRVVVEALGVDSIYSFNWSSTTRHSKRNAGPTRDTINDLCGGRQFVVVSNNSCFDTLFFDVPIPVGVKTNPTLTFSNPTCNGRFDGTATLSAILGNPGYTYRWRDNGSNNPSRNDLGNGFYYFTITDSKLCTFEDSIEMIEPEPLVANIVAQATNNVSCNGFTNGSITAAWFGGNAGPARFTWSPNAGNDSTLTNLTSGTYMLTITDIRNCTDTISYTITEPPALVPVIPAIGSAFCPDDEVEITVLSATGGNGQPYVFTIDNSPPFSLGERVPVTPSTYRLRLIDSRGCFKDTSIIITAPSALSVAFINSPAERKISLGDSVLLRSNIISSFPIDSVHWDPSNSISDITLSSTYARPPKTTTYILTVWDDRGCSSTAEITIEVESDRRFYVPNVISANKDGLHDDFTLYIGNGVKEVHSVKIFDRWGELLFIKENIISTTPSSTGIYPVWNASFRGNLVQPGVYVYVADVEFIDKRRIMYRGDFTVLR